MASGKGDFGKVNSIKILLLRKLSEGIPVLEKKISIGEDPMFIDIGGMD
jgi:hypothetical protein